MTMKIDAAEVAKVFTDLKLISLKYANGLRNVSCPRKS